MITKIYILICFLILLNYVYLILRFYFGLPKKEEKQSPDILQISIVIAFRNEEKNLPTLINSIKKLDFPQSQMEVVLVNDQSSDSSVEIVEDFVKSNSNVFLLHSKGGKKKAIYEAIKFSHFPIIACTDADCTFSEKWLSTVSNAFSNPDIHLVLGPVFFNEKSGFLNSIFSLEFSSLMASTAGSAGMGNAIMANGANIAFRKNSYFKVSEKIVDSKFASGDDAFLLSEIKNEYGKKSVIFNYLAEGVVITDAPESLKAFFNQRFRWASKSHKLNDFFTSYVAFIVVAINVLILFSVLIGLFLLNKSLIFTAIIIFILKSIVDFLLLHRFLLDFKRKNFLKNFILVQLFYPIYITVVVLFSPFMNAKWKGRKIKN